MWLEIRRQPRPPRAAPRGACRGRGGKRRGFLGRGSRLGRYGLRRAASARHWRLPRGTGVGPPEGGQIPVHRAPTGDATGLCRWPGTKSQADSVDGAVIDAGADKPGSVPDHEFAAEIGNTGGCSGRRPGVPYRQMTKGARRRVQSEAVDRLLFGASNQGVVEVSMPHLVLGNGAECDVFLGRGGETCPLRVSVADDQLGVGQGKEYRAERSTKG